MAHFILAIDWTDPKIFGPLLAAGGAVIGALITGFFTVWGKKKADQPSVKQEQSQQVQVGLDERGVGRELENKLTPLRERLASIEQQLSPKMPPSESADPLKVKAVELYNKGVDLHEANDIRGATRKYDAAVELAPDFVYAHNNLGNALKAKGDLDGAIAEYREALRIDPDFAPAHSNLGLALMAKGELDAAISEYHEALRNDPDFAHAHNNLGNALKAKGDLDGAIAEYREALHIDPDHAALYYNLGCAFGVRAEAGEALANLERAIELDEGLREKAKTDSDFDGIRDDPAFRKLVDGE